MPTYDYRCNGCGHTYELFQSMKDKPVKKCPACGKAAAERLIGTGAAVLFKGSGFYQTDYRSETYKKSAEADKPSAATASDSTASAAEKKADAPAAKPETTKAEPSKPATSTKNEAPAAKATPAPTEKKPAGKAGSKSR